MIARRPPPIWLVSAALGLGLGAALGLPTRGWAQGEAPSVVLPAPEGPDADGDPAEAPSVASAPASPLQGLFDRFAIHGQTTFTEQAHPSFSSPYVGTNSLTPAAMGRETWDATVDLGVRLWSGAEVWIAPEIDQGFGLDDTLGVAGFPSGEAYKVGRAAPYLRLPEFFVRQTIDLGGGEVQIDAEAGQMAQTVSQNRLVVTVGKFAVTSVFDLNSYAHDPRGDFLNWTIIDAGTFDYAAEAWGYSAGAAMEWYTGPWTVRGGFFLLSNVPNGPYLDTRFDQYQLIGELERRYALGAHPGKILVTGFLSRGRMGTYADAIAYAQANGGAPSTALVRRLASRPGVSVDWQQEVTGDLGAFLRAGWADGRYEAYEFTDVDETVSGGLSLKGRAWGRAQDTVGLAGVINLASPQLIAYLADGGLGVLVGDGKLPHPGSERIGETYYDFALSKIFDAALDYQLVVNPGYNRDRGPASIFALRLHAQF